jgi:tRNA/rRNA methyltransferase
LEEFRKKIISGGVSGEIAILFGREGIGLSEGEIRACDLLITIPTSARYPVMNLSHSLAVALYALCAQERRIRNSSAASDAKERAYLKKTFEKLVDYCSGNLRNPQKTKTAFARVMGRAVPDETEVRAMLAVLAQIEKKLRKTG